MTKAGYDIAVHGLLRKRAELLTTLEVKRDELAAAQNDLLAVERVLSCFGFNEELDQPRRRVMTDIRRELARFIIEEIRRDGPHTTTGLS